MMLNDDVAYADGYANPSGGTGSQIHLLDNNYKYLATDFKLEAGSWPVVGGLGVISKDNLLLLIYCINLLL